VPSCCEECKAFKARQQPLFDGGDGVDAKPFLKWAGGKRQLSPQMLKHVPAYSGRYFEPFVGGGAFFFALQPTVAVLADINGRLVRAYGGVRYNVEAVIEKLRGYPFDKDFYLKLRAEDVDGYKDDVDVACWLIYLNRTGFNGLYRVNRNGGFNVPWGKYKNPTICDAENLRAVSNMLRCAEFICGDFEHAVCGAKEGDLVYFDPPYMPSSSTSNFTSYAEGKFNLNEQVRLRDVALSLKSRGVHVMLTNSNTKAVRDLYGLDEFKIRRVKARGSVAAKGKSRGERIDLLIM
jgi:DNA adenine methylase